MGTILCRYLNGVISMKCQKIVAHITRTNEKDKINKSIVAFGQRFHVASVFGLSWNYVEVTYVPIEDLLEEENGS